MHIRRIILALLVVSGACAAGNARTGSAQTPDDWTTIYRAALLPDYQADMLAHADAPRYSIDLWLAASAEDATITGQQTVTYTNRTGTTLNEIVFRLYPNLESYGGEMIISGVSAGGVGVLPVLDDTRSIMTVSLPEPLAPGAALTLAMAFETTIQADIVALYGQFGYLDGVLALPNVYPMLSVYDAGSGWWDETAQPQGDIVFSETAFYDVRITAPSHLLLATSGSTIALSANGDGTLTHQFVAPLMRDFMITASDNFVTLNGEQDGVRITLYYDATSPASATQARNGLQIAQNTLRIFNATFGVYPFSELDIVQTPNGAGGMEYPGLFVLDSETWDTNTALFEFLLVHETAHQWWYSLVGSDQARDPWLDEALAQFAVAVYIRAQEGDEAYTAALESFRSQHASYITEHPDQRIGGPVSDYQGLAYFNMVYQKGPLLYAALDQAYGYDAVIAALRDYFAVYRYGIAYPNNLRASLETSLGTSLSALFAEWVAPQPVG